MNVDTKRFVVGVDPGYGGTGAVMRLSTEAEPLESAVWQNDETNDLPVLRAMSICIPLIETVVSWVEEYDIEELEVCIETPFYNKNPGTLMVQMSLFVMLQAYVYDYLVPLVPKVYLTLVHNATSKSKMAHDPKADKHKMIAASPWFNYKEQGLTFLMAHTLADAYAHSLSVYTSQYALHDMPQYIVPMLYQEGSDAALAASTRPGVRPGKKCD